MFDCSTKENDHVNHRRQIGTWTLKDAAQAHAHGTTSHDTTSHGQDDIPGNLSRRSFVAFGATAVACAALPSCVSQSGATDSDSRSSGDSSLALWTGNESGTYYELGSVLAQHANDNAGLDIVVMSSEGSKENVLSLENGSAQLAFCQADIMSYAYLGEGISEGAAPIDCFSVVASLYEEMVQIVTCDPAITSVADLMGRNVSVSTANSGVHFNALDILGSYGIAEYDITPKHMTFQQSADALVDGSIDAAFVVAGIPTSVVSSMASMKDIHLVGVDKDHIASLISKSPFYAEAVIPAGTYVGQDDDVVTLSVSAVMLAHNSCSEQDIYALAADVFGNLPELADSYDLFGEFSIEKGASVTVVPYHPGAARYFQEKG